MRDDLSRDVRDMQPAPTASALVELRDMGRDLARLDTLIEQHERKLKELKTQRHELVFRTIPDLMDAAGTDRVGIPEDNADLVVEPYFKAVLPEEHAAEAAQWLDERGHGDMIRTVVSVDFSPGEREHAHNVMTLISSYFRGRNIEQREPVAKNTIHWKTLTAFVKDETLKGNPIPWETLGAEVGRQARVKARKKEHA